MKLQKLYLLVALVLSVFAAIIAFFPTFRTIVYKEVKGIADVQSIYLPKTYQNYGIPHGVLVLPDGDVWYVDTIAQRVVRVNPAGQVVRTFGRTGTDEGEFEHSIWALTRDNEGNLYVTSDGGVYKFDFNGGFLLRFGHSGGDLPYGFSSSHGIWYDASSDTILVTDQNINVIRRFAKDGTHIATYGSYGTGDGQFTAAFGLTTDATGNIYVVDSNGHRVQVLDPTGNFLYAFGSNNPGNYYFQFPKDVRILPNGHIVVTSQNSSKIKVFDSTGNYLSEFGENGSQAWQFILPEHLSVDSSGYIYVSDWANNTIQKFTEDGTFVSGIRNGGKTEGKFSFPGDTAYDSLGNLYVLDDGAYNGRVQKFTNSGTFLSTIIPTGNLYIASYHMNIDALDRIWIGGHNGVKVFDLSGTLLMNIGTWGSGVGQFDDARGIDFDSAGNAYIADLYNCRVQKYDSAGNYITSFGSCGTGVGQLVRPTVVLIDGTDKIYVASNEDGYAGYGGTTSIRVFDVNGNELSQIGSFGWGDGQFIVITGMAFAENGDLLVADRNKDVVQIFNHEGTVFKSKFGERGSGLGQFYEVGSLTKNPVTNVITASDARNHRIQVLATGARIYNLISSVDVYRQADDISLANSYIDPLQTGADTINSEMSFGPYIVSDFIVDLTDDRDWSPVNVVAIPAESKAVIVNLNPSQAPGVSATHSLYVVRNENQQSVVVCPDAVSIFDVTTSCPNSYELFEGDPQLSTVTIGGITYWKISGLTGTGAFSLTLPTTPTPSASPSQPLVTTSVNPSSSPTVSIVVTGSPTPSVSVPATTASPTPTLPVTTVVATGTVTVSPTPVSGDSDTVQCPQFTEFSQSSTIVKPGDTVVISWKTKYTELVKSTLDSQVELPATGDLSVSPDKTMTIDFVADNGSCKATKQTTISVVSVYPWEITTGTAGALLAVEALVATTQPAFIGNIWLSIASIFDRRKRRTAGYVFDSVTKQPVARAVIRLIDAKTEEVVDTVVSDANGIFRLTPAIGTFVVTVTHSHYDFPSKVATTQDGINENVYRGAEFRVKGDHELVIMSIPLDPQKLTEGQIQSAKVKQLLSLIAVMLSTVVLFAGLGYSFYCALAFPLSINYAILFIYLVLFGIKFVSIFDRQKESGTVRLTSGGVATGVEVGLFDVEFGTLLYRTFTDENGRYVFVVPAKKYVLKIVDLRYKLHLFGAEATQFVVEKKKTADGVMLVTEDLHVSEAKQPTAEPKKSRAVKK